MASKEEEVSSQIKAKIASYVKKRGISKRKVTIILKKLKDLHSESDLTSTFCTKQLALIESEVIKIKEVDEAINTVMLENPYPASECETELDGQADYHLNLSLALDEFETYLIVKKDDLTTANKLVDIMSKFDTSEGKPPPLQCGTFSGTEKDKFAFSNFLIQFENVIGHKKNLSDSAKQSYLLSYLRGYALKVISHLAVSEENYKVALKLLRDEFLDVDYIVDETYRNLLQARPSFKDDSEFSNVKEYISEVRSYLFELKHHGVDFLEENTAGNSLVSHIIFNKLPYVFKKELASKAVTNFPTLQDIFDYYLDVIKHLKLGRSARKETGKKFDVVKNQEKNKVFESNRTLQNFGTKNVTPKPKFKYKANNFPFKPCKLCGETEHGMGWCKSYPTLDDRIKRLQDLSLCTRCAGSHSSNDCFGKNGKLSQECKYCKTRDHISPLCNQTKVVSSSSNLCLGHQRTDPFYLLPTMTIDLIHNKVRHKVRCMIDWGSQRTYISGKAAKILEKDLGRLSHLQYNIQTSIGSSKRDLQQFLLGFEIEGNIINMPVLVDKNLQLRYEIPGMNDAVKNLKGKFKLADESYYSDRDHTKFDLDLLLGIDLWQFVTKISVERFMRGTCIMYNNKVIPIGNVKHFMNEAEIDKLLQEGKQLLVEDICSRKEESLVNFVLDPIQTYFNPLETILTDSEIDNGLENLFKFESIGIKGGSDEMINYDRELVDKFEKGIIFTDGKYHVDLPWFEDKVKLVPSNYKIALKVLDKVTSFLQRENLTEKYEEVFNKQLEAGIIEEIEVSPQDYENFTWIPHRPVLKTEEQVTTKIRPVFNCSLKSSKELPSLNEAAYPGIDLLSSLLKLMLVFRTNEYTLLSDIKQAFLMIRLKNEFDKNRFCFFWKRRNKLVKFRYRTIVFGYTSSPFILHYIMKYHAQQFHKDKISKLLSNNFYVDNLIITSNNLDELKHLYNETYNRMALGGFELRSWNSNSQEMREIMMKDGRLVEHQSAQERVLGYLYDFREDCLKLSPVNLDFAANTKRKILSGTSKPFDPLGLALPVTVGGRNLMRKIWQLDVKWDQELPSHITSEWCKLSKDLAKLPSLNFNRHAVNDKSSYGLHIFSDSSIHSYAFVAYASNDEGNSLLFAKSKLVPFNRASEHSIPMLELLGVILAYKCLPTILEAYHNIEFKFVNFCVDAQVVLNWLVTKEVKAKSKFLRNRILELKTLEDGLQENFSLPVHYSYVNTSHNPADLITKGLTFKKFSANLKFWQNGPEWLSNDFSNWPSYPMLSVSSDHRNKIITKCAIQPMEKPFIQVKNYSDLNKLLRVTAYVFKPFCNKLGGDPHRKAIEYWIREVQQTCFHKEIKFLTNKGSDKKVPPLIENLNLFLDDRGFLRCRGRISKCVYYDYNVHNPILLSKHHYFTELFIKECHSKVQHLGIGTTLNFLREQGYWIPLGRSAVKKVLSNCPLCKKFNALAYKYPKFTGMPKHKMNLVKPFNHVGVDYTGHLWVTDEKTGASFKMYILIFTCLNIRALHFELLPDMSVRNFLLAFQRFCNKYTIPEYLYSDNALQFLKGGQILQQSLNSEEFCEELRKCRIKHIKIPLYSAWVGSAWERLIRVLKMCLYKTVGRNKLSYFEMITTLSHIENAINSRPLTYRASNKDLECITPNSFLKLHGNSSLILRDEIDNVWTEDPSPTQLENTLSKQETMFENFRRLWFENYLLSLREHDRRVYQSNWKNQVRVGEVVLIKTPNKARPFWNMGRILEIICGFDNKIRSVKLKQSNGRIEYHSICNLYPLELSQNHVRPENIDDNDDNTNDVEPVVEPAQPTGTRPKRKAAEKFRKMIRDNIEYL